VASLRRWLFVSLSASSLLAACGGAAHRTQPPLQKRDAAQLIALAQAVARDAPNDGCAARREIDALSAKANDLVSAGRVPLRLKAPLLAGVAAVAADAPACAPPAPKKGKEKHHKEKHGHKGD
jgi:hypothetical protein